MNANNWVSACREIKIEGSRGHGKDRKTWHESVVEDMRKLGLSKEIAQDCATWNRAILGDCLTRASRM